MDEVQVRKRLDEIGYTTGPGGSDLVAYTSKHALLVVGSSTGSVIVDLGTGREVATYYSRQGAERAFHVYMLRDDEG